MSNMNFQKYQELARKVFPTLPSDFEDMPDAAGTYQLVNSYCYPRIAHDTSKWTDQQTIDFFSVAHWTVTKLRELNPPLKR